MSRWTIYGANGYTGELTARLAKARGATPILSGRNERAVRALAEELGFEHRVFALGDPAAAVRALDGVETVLHCAGPFSATSRPMLDACCRAKAHYLDITGEISVFEYVHMNAARWREAGIVAMPGVGFDVVPSDCLAAMLKRDLPEATSLRLAFRSRKGKLSPGTTKTMLEGVPEGGKIRRAGRIERVPSAYKVEEIEFEPGAPSLAVTIPWGDVSTAFHSTGIPNIEVFIGTSPGQLKQMKTLARLGPLLAIGPLRRFAQARIGARVKGPTDEERARDETLLYGEATAGDGRKIVRRLRTPEGYTLTADTGLTTALRVGGAGLAPGAWTPSKAFGPDYILEFEGVVATRSEG